MTDAAWILVDLREPDDPAVLCRDGLPRDRTSLTRTLSSVVGATRGRTLATALAAWARDLPAGLDHQVPGLSLRPVPGPGRAVHAVWVCPGDPETPAPAALSLEWDPSTRTVTQPAEAGSLDARTGNQGEDVRFTTAEALRVVEVIDTIGLAQAMLGRPTRRWQGPVRVRSRGSTVDAVVDLLPAGPGRPVVGVVFRARGTTVTASAEALAVAALSKIVPVHVVLMDVHKMRVLRWLTDPPDGVAWKGLRDNRDTPHPEDVARIVEMASAVLRGDIVRGSLDGIRLRRLEGGWLVVDASGELVLGSEPPLLVLQMQVRGESDEPDPSTGRRRGSHGRTVMFAVANQARLCFPEGPGACPGRCRTTTWSDALPA